MHLWMLTRILSGDKDLARHLNLVSGLIPVHFLGMLMACHMADDEGHTTQVIPYTLAAKWDALEVMHY